MATDQNIFDNNIDGCERDSERSECEREEYILYLYQLIGHRLAPGKEKNIRQEDVQR